MKSNEKEFEFRKWTKQRAEGIILTYLQGTKKRATLNWTISCLKKDLEYKWLSFDDIQRILLEIKSNPFSCLLNRFPQRREKLDKIQKKLEELGVENEG